VLYEHLIQCYDAIVYVHPYISYDAVMSEHLIV